jgi:hypothetical protein
MRRIDLLFAAALVLVVLGAFHFADPRRRLVHNDDSEVLDTVLILLLSSASSSPTAKLPDFVTVTSDYLSPNREDFKHAIDAAIRSGEKVFGSQLLDIKVVALDKSRVVEPFHIKDTPLNQLDLDNRIVVRPPPNSFQPTVRNRNGTLGRVHTVAAVGMPVYSPDGKTAIVRLATGDARGVRLFWLVVLEKQDGKWGVKYRISAVGPPRTGPR